jgi:hypothetical protein
LSFSFDKNFSCLHRWEVFSRPTGFEISVFRLKCKSSFAFVASAGGGIEDIFNETSLEHAAQSFCTMICGLTVPDSGTEKFHHTLLFTLFHFDLFSSAVTILTFQLAPSTQQKFSDVS